jgi:hypothetical protein
MCLRDELSIGRLGRDRSVEPIRSAQKRPVTSSATASLIRRSQPVMHRRTLLARCSATVSSLRGLADPNGPSLLLGSAALMGFNQRPSQVCSRSGCPIISDQPGPRACSSGRAPRFIFVGSICRRLGNNKGRNCGGTSRVRSDWLLGLTPVCGPCLQASGSHVAASTPEDRSCLGLCLSQGCGHGLVQPAGLDPVRIIQLQGLSSCPSSARGLTSGVDNESRHGLPFSVLRGQMPCPSGHFSMPGKGSLSEVSHLP